MGNRANLFGKIKSGEKLVIGYPAKAEREEGRFGKERKKEIIYFPSFSDRNFHYGDFRP